MKKQTGELILAGLEEAKEDVVNDKRSILKVFQINEPTQRKRAFPMITTCANKRPKCTFKELKAKNLLAAT